MKLTKLLALILCLLLCLTFLLACKDEPTNNNNGDTPPSTEGGGDSKEEPSELETHIARARTYYNNACVKITTELTVTKGETLMQEETDLCFVQGENKISFAAGNPNTVLHIYADGKLYAPSTKKYFQFPNIDFLRQNYIAPKFHVTLFDTFQYEEVTVTKNPDGTTTVSGVTPAEEAKGEVEALFGPALALEGATFDYSSLCSELVFDAEGRLLRQCAKVAASAYGSTIQLQQTESYEYGIQFAVNVPADVNSYTAVTSITDLFQE